MSGRPLGWPVAAIAVTALALAWLTWSLASAPIPASLWTPQVWTTLAAAAAIQGVGLLFVAFGWLTVLRVTASDSQAHTVDLLRLYGVTQLLKYLPSNLMHQVGRHAALRRLGIGHAASLLAALAEIILLIVGAGLVAATSGVIAATMLDGRLAAILGGVFLLIAVAAVAIRLLGPAVGEAPWFASVRALLLSPAGRRAALVACGSFAIFFVLSGTSFALVSHTILSVPGPSWMSLVAIWCGAWILGFVTPGAPAGLGTREALLAVALSAAGHPEGAVATALAMRVASVGGDLLLAAMLSAAASGPRSGRLGLR
jgi:glycosyltransferase 2 family protein